MHLVSATHTEQASIAAAVDRLVAGTKRRTSDLIPILQQIQAEYRYLPKEALHRVAEALGLSPATVYGVATFYAQFSLEPKGKWIIRVCDGTACHVRGAQRNLDALRQRLGLGPEASTTQDGLFSLEVVSCLGACGLAPVVVVGEDVHGQVTPEALRQVLEQIVQEEIGERPSSAAEVRAE